MEQGGKGNRERKKREKEECWVGKKREKKRNKEKNLAEPIDVAS